jgi:hypothetical protein
MKFDQEIVKILRESTSSVGIEKTAQKAAAILGRAGIPHLIVGGYALQEHGYARFTMDVDLVVPDIEQAKDVLAINGFTEVPGTTKILKDRENKVTIDLLPGGGNVSPTTVNFPVPSTVTKEPNVIEIESLISLKLGSWAGSKIRRAKDLGDVVELIKARNLPKDLKVDPSVQEEYINIWSNLNGLTP